MKFKENEYSIEEKIQILHDFGWYEYYENLWRTPNMSEMGGADFDSAFRSCLRCLIFDGGQAESEYFDYCHKIYLNVEEKN